MSTTSGGGISVALWAHHQPDLQKACFFRRICETLPPKEYRLTPIVSQIQEGPTCGLTAISMLLGQTVAPTDLLRQAIKMEYTQNGEMFSATNMLNILLAQAPNDIEAYLHDGVLSCDAIRNEMKVGSLLLVPYDPDVDHTPTLLNGHKAHWCLVVGYLIDEMDDFYVLSRHGKSKLLAAWKLDNLSASNANLVEFAQPTKHVDKDFVLPDGGIAGPNGLCKKAIVITKFS